MTPTQTVRLVGIISQGWPSMKLNEFTADVWHPWLQDLDFDDAIEAVNTIAKTRSGYIDAGAIRLQAAKTAGLLAPDEAAAFQMANAVVGNGGNEVSKLPPAVQEAYWEMGGRFGFHGPPSVIRPQWGRVYGEIRQRLEAEVLGGDLGAAIEASRLAALEPADIPPPPELEPPASRGAPIDVSEVFRRIPTDRERTDRP